MLEVRKAVVWESRQFGLKNAKEIHSDTKPFDDLLLSTVTQWFISSFFKLSNKSLFYFRMTNDWQREKNIRREEYDEKIKKSCDDFD